MFAKLLKIKELLNNKHELHGDKTHINVYNLITAPFAHLRSLAHLLMA